MGKGLVITGPVLVAFALVVIVEAIATHALLRDATAMTHAILAIAHVSALGWLVMRFARSRDAEAPVSED